MTTLPQTMKAVGLKHYLSIDDKNSLVDITLHTPIATGRDLLIEVAAIAVNPVDTKVRSPKSKIEDDYRVLGWDAVGKVVAAGDKTSLFKPGDEVYYAGSITRAGSNSQYHLIDERVVGPKPKTLSYAEAAALPLTGITAWESLFDRLQLTDKDAGKSLLIIGAAGGVGSIAIQLAKQISNLQVIATASRPESQQWCRDLGADVVVDHTQLIEQLHNNNIKTVDYILCLHNTDQHWAAMADIIKPQGKICLIVELADNVDFNLFKNKSVTVAWEMMFTRTMFSTEDMIQQHHLLKKISDLIDAQKIKSSLNKVISPINAENLREAHRLIETGKSIGKIVLEKW